MAGAQIELTLDGIAEAEAALGRLATTDLEALAYTVGELIESSTGERIATEKTSPEGEPWADWSPAHAATRQPRHSLLVQDNHLLTSVQNLTQGTTVRVGSNMIYAAIHQFGGKAGRGRKVTIPARPYMGLSDQDRDDIEMLVLDTLEGRLQ